MKKIFAVLLQYFLIIFGSALLGMLIYALFDSSTHLIAGFSLSFNLNAVVKGIFLGILISLFLAGMLLCCFRISSSSGKIQSFITYICLGCLTWALFLPLMLKCNQMVCGGFRTDNYKEKELSSGFFRNFQDKTFYFISDETDEKAKVAGVSRKTSGKDNVFFGEIDLSTSSDFVNEGRPFSDPLIKTAYEDVPFTFFGLCSNLFINAERMLDKGFLGWLIFASLGVALWSLYGFVKVSSWNLANVFVVVFFSFAILLFNATYYFPRFSFLHGLMDDDLMLAILNLSTGAIFIVSGIIINSVKRRK